MAKANLQTVIVSKDIAATRAGATKVARPHANRIYTSRQTATSWRFRQRPPTDFVKGSFRTFKIPEDPGVSLVYGKLKADKVAKKKRASKKKAAKKKPSRRRKNPGDAIIWEDPVVTWNETRGQGAIGWVGDMVSKAAYYHIAWVSPGKFLEYVDPSFEPEERSLEWLRSAVAAGKKFSPLQVHADSYEGWTAFPRDSKSRPDVRQHEGRNRAWIAREMGISKIPVIVWLNRDDARGAKKDGLFLGRGGGLVDLHTSYSYEGEHPDWGAGSTGYLRSLRSAERRNPSRRVGGKSAKKNPPVTRAQLRRWQRYNERAAEATNLKDLANLAKKGREWMKDERMLYVFDSEVAERATAFGVKCNLKDVKSVRRCVGELIENQGRTLFDNPSKRRVLRNPKVMPDPGPSAWLGGLLEWAWDGKDGEYLWEPNGEWIFLWSPELKAVVGIPMPRDRKRLAKVSRKSGGAKMFERFTARDAENTYEISIPQVKLEKLGKAKHIVYRSDKWNPGEDTDYIHDFKDGVQLYVGPSIGKPKVFLCFGGKLTATERGLIY